MKARTTIILTIILIALGVYWFGFEVKTPTTDKAKEYSSKVFGGESFVKREDGSQKGLGDLVTKIEIRGTEKPIVLERTKEGDDKIWHLKSPIERRADDSEASGLLSELEFLSRDETVKPEKDKQLNLADYGLDKPERSVKLWIGEDSWTLNVGKKISLGNKVYVKRADEDVAVITSDSVHDKAHKSLDDFRDKVALRADKDDATSVVLAVKDKPEISCRKEKGLWNLVKPIRDLASKSDIEKIIDDLKDVKIDAEDFITDDDSKLESYGLDKPVLSVTVREGEAGRTLLFGSKSKEKDKSGKIYAKRAGEPTVFLLKEDDMKKARKSIKDLRSKKALTFTVDDVNRIEMTLGDEKMLAVKDDDDWKIQQPDKVDADKSQVEDYLREVTDLEVEDWVDEEKPDLAKYGLDKPAVVLNFGFKGSSASLLVGKKVAGEKKGLYVRRGDTGPVLVVKEEFDKTARSGYLALLPKDVLSFTKQDADRVEIVKPGKRIIAKKEGDDWKLLSPVRFEADTYAVDDLLWDMYGLKAKELVERKPKDLAAYGLDKPEIRITVRCQETVEDDKEGKEADKEKKEEAKKKAVDYVLLIGKSKDKDTRYAVVEGKEMVFLLGDSFLKKLNAEYARKRVLKFEKADVKTVSLNYTVPSSKAVSFERKEDKWRMTAPEDKLANQDEVDDLVSTLSYLTADSIPEYEPKDLKKYGLDAPVLHIVAEFKDGKKAELRVGKEKGDKRYVLGSETKFVYLVSETDIARLEKQKPEPPKKEADKMAEGEVKKATPEAKDQAGTPKEKAKPAPASPKPEIKTPAPDKKPAAKAPVPQPGEKPKPEKGATTKE